jgi:hypothetical protein
MTATNRTATPRLPARPVAEITFGIELEITLPRTHTMRVGGYHRGLQVSGLPRGCESQSDASIRAGSGRRGVEIVSPVLKGTEGLREVDEVCRTLRGWGAKVNRSCGCHVHAGVRRNDLRTINNMLHTVANFELALYASTGSPDRMGNTYAGTIKRARLLANPNRLGDLDGRGLARYQTANIQNLIAGRRATVEIRAFAGTTNGTKAIAYIRMTLAMMERSENKRRIGWDAAQPQATSCVARKSGRGNTELTRFFYTMGWIKGREATEWGNLQGPGLPTTKDIKKALTTLAKKFDAKERRGPTASVA